MKILIVDDDLELLTLVGFAIRRAGYLAVEASHGEEALEVFRREQPDLVILDVNLPGLNGFEVLKRIRQESSAPVMMLTVRSGEENEVHGLDLGADDYLTKPFSPRTLLARVRALLRRQAPGGAEGGPEGQPLTAGDLTLEIEQQTVRVCDEAPVRLTNLEFRLLQYLLVNAGHTLPADRLTQHVWGSRGAGDRQMLKQLVHRLRQKVERDPTSPQYVLTVPGVGYMLQARVEA